MKELLQILKLTVMFGRNSRNSWVRWSSSTFGDHSFTPGTKILAESTFNVSCHLCTFVDQYSELEDVGIFLKALIKSICTRYLSKACL